MKAADDKKTYVGVRLDAEQLARIDALAEGLYGLKASRSDVIRLAIERGLDALEHGPNQYVSRTVRRSRSK